MIKGTTVAIKEMRHAGNLYKIIGSTVTGNALIGAIKKPKSSLKKSGPVEKFKEPLSFMRYSRIESGTRSQLEDVKVERGERTLEGMQGIKV